MFNFNKNQTMDPQKNEDGEQIAGDSENNTVWLGNTRFCLL